MGGVASTIGEAAGVVGAPFTGGASLALTAGLATAGAVAGAEGTKTHYDTTAGVNLARAGQTENTAFDYQNGSLNTLAGYINNYGPNRQDYSAGVEGQRDLASMLQQYSQNGGMPTQAEINQANGITSNLYAADQASLNNSFYNQNIQAQRLSAQLGRPVNDPILQAKLRTGFMQQQAVLSAEEQGTAQQIAMQIPQNQLNYAGQRANVLAGLGNSAMSNQAYLLGLGNQIGNQERNFRLQTGQRYQNGSTSSGGGLMGAISGALGGLAGGAQASNTLFGSGGILNFGGGGGINNSSYASTAAQPAPSLMPGIASNFTPYSMNSNMTMQNWGAQPVNSYGFGPASPFNPRG